MMGYTRVSIMTVKQMPAKDLQTASGDAAGVAAPTGDAPARDLSTAAGRALAEAEARRAAYRAREAAGPAEIGGRGGKDPARYGDWEVKGRASDF